MNIGPRRSLLLRGCAVVGLMCGGFPLHAQEASASRSEMLKQLESLSAKSISRVAACPKGEMLALGQVRQPVEVKTLEVNTASSPPPVTSFLQIQAPESKTWSVVALLDGEPQALVCTVVGGKTSAFVVSGTAAGVRVSRFNVTEREVVWETVTAQGDIQPYDLAVDGRGQPFVLSAVRGKLTGTEDHGGQDILVQRLSDTGKVVWTARYGTLGDELGLRLGLSGQSEIWVAGTTTGKMAAQAAERPEVTPDNRDIFVMQLVSGLGKVLGQWQFGSTAHDVVTDLLVSERTIWVSGYSYGDLFASNQGGADAFLMALNGQGEMKAHQQLGSAEADAISSLATWRGDEILVASYSDHEGRNSTISRFGLGGMQPYIHFAGTINSLAAHPNIKVPRVVAGGTLGDQATLNNFEPNADLPAQSFWQANFGKLSEHLDSQEVTP